jgi:hypothetical protein
MGDESELALAAPELVPIDTVYELYLKHVEVVLSLSCGQDIVEPLPQGQLLQMLLRARGIGREGFSNGVKYEVAQVALDGILSHFVAGSLVAKFLNQAKEFFSLVDVFKDGVG